MLSTPQKNKSKKNNVETKIREAKEEKSAKLESKTQGNKRIWHAETEVKDIISFLFHRNWKGMSIRQKEMVISLYQNKNFFLPLVSRRIQQWIPLSKGRDLHYSSRSKEDNWFSTRSFIVNNHPNYPVLLIVSAVPSLALPSVLASNWMWASGFLSEVCQYRWIFQTARTVLWVCSLASDAFSNQTLRISGALHLHHQESKCQWVWSQNFSSCNSLSTEFALAGHSLVVSQNITHYLVISLFLAVLCILTQTG